MSIYSDIRTALSDIVDVRDDQKRLEIKILLMEKVSNAQEQYLELYEKYTQILQEKSALESAANEINKYELHLLSKKSGFWAYKFMTDDETKLHYLCQTCWDSTHKKQVLRINDIEFCECPVCGNSQGVYLNGRPDVPVRTSHPRMASDVLKGF